MLFNSTAFVFAFLPVVFLVYFFLNSRRLTHGAKAWLILASLFFYAWWEPIHLPLLLVSIYVNFRAGSLLPPDRPGAPVRRRRAALVAALAFNLLLLGFFKYAAFAVGSINGAFGAAMPVPELPLPLGVSFFTFTQIAWLVDRYQGKAKGSSVLDYVLFVTYFPHLIAGPILHHREMISQFESRWTRVVRHRNLLFGLLLFSIGLFKKVVLADGFAGWADAGFDSGAPLMFFEGWACSLAYTFQLYFDFSGYCDMALGVSMLFNIRLPINFNSPYKALDIQDFWRRWHITLGRYLRDYLYIPLGGNRCGVPREYLNLMITFVLGGLWHGASGMFILWGALHGAALVAHRAWTARGGRMPRALAWTLTFLFVNTAWVFFRARSLDVALRVLGAMVDLRSILGTTLQQVPTRELAWAGTRADGLPAWLPPTLFANAPCLLAVALALVIVAQRNSMALAARHSGRPVGVACGVVLLSVGLLVMLASRSTVFLYFNF